jgi:hypothetical protein
MADLKKIDIKEINRKLGFDTLDDLRNARSDDFDTAKVSAVLKTIVDSFNALLDDYLQIKEVTLKMRDRKKPGPKPKKK